MEGLANLLLHFAIPQRDVAMTTNLGKIGKIGDIPSFVVPAFQNGLQYRNADF